MIDADMIEAVARLVGRAWVVARAGESMPGVTELKAEADKVASLFCLHVIPER